MLCPGLVGPGTHKAKISPPFLSSDTPPVAQQLSRKEKKVGGNVQICSNVHPDFMDGKMLL